MFLRQTRLLTLGLLLPVATAMADYIQPSFAEPRTGKKVSSYSVDLPVSRSEKKTFHIPTGCKAAIESAWLSGAQQWGGRVDRSTWWKVRRDCDYVDFLRRSPSPPEYDFVSGYDFRNAYLKDLSMRLRCGRQEGSDCTSRQTGNEDITSLLPIVEQAAEVEPDVALQPCQFENGMFRGKMLKGPSGLNCVTDPLSSGFRIIAVDYADVNGDNYQDVILRLIPIGPGLRRAPMIVPLTRMEFDGPFTTPGNIAIPSYRPHR
ncbi:MAG: ferric uptake regulator family protein [Candidatus Sedimenticola sp. (ex Thyasira tokunagai)]